MKKTTRLHLKASIGILSSLMVVSAFAQTPTPKPTSQEQEYETSWGEYIALKEKANGGTKHTYETLPNWKGVWRSSNRVRHSFDFSVVKDRADLPQYKIISAELTPKYVADYEKHIEEIKTGLGWDRLSDCLPAGFPRWLTEPFSREFVPTPDQTWLSHEQVNETRRVYTDGRGHGAEDFAIPLWLGDSIGFWNEDTLVIHTTNLKAGRYQRGQPAYSFQTSTVEQWRMIDQTTMLVKITIYDPPALVKPWHAEFTYAVNHDPEIRVNYNSCEENNMVIRMPSGEATILLPGDTDYNDPTTFGIPEVTWDTIPE
jgi:hypothetical protein